MFSLFNIRRPINILKYGDALIAFGLVSSLLLFHFSKNVRGLWVLLILIAIPTAAAELQKVLVRLAMKKDPACDFSAEDRSSSKFDLPIATLFAVKMVFVGAVFAYTFTSIVKL